MLEGLLFNIAAPRTGEKKTSLDSGVQGCFPQDRRRGTRERERVCACVRGVSSVPVSLPRPGLLGSKFASRRFSTSASSGSFYSKKSCSGCSYLYISLFSTILSIVSVFFVFIPCFCSHFSCAAYFPFSDSWAVFWFGSKGLNGMPDLFLPLFLLLLLPLLVLLLVL